MVEKWHDGMVKLVELSNRRMVKCWKGEIGGVVKLSKHRMVELWNGEVSGVVDSSNRRMAEWHSFIAASGYFITCHGPRLSFCPGVRNSYH